MHIDIRKILAKYIIFPIQNRGSRLRKNLKEIEKSQWLPYEKIREIQWNKFQKLLNYTYANVPYYTTLFNKKGIKIADIESFDDLWKIPYLSKKIIKENFNNIFSLTVDRETLIKRTTSGSTGEPVSVFWDLYMDYKHNATAWRFRKWTGHNIGDRYARIWGQAVVDKSIKKVSFKSKIKEKFDNIFELTEKLNANDTVSDSMLEDFFQRIKRKRIRLLVGYASSVYFFAQFINRNHPGEIKLKSIRTISEMLYDYQRQLIEKAFDCKVFDIYGNRENGLIAAECSQHEGYHINAENLYIEVLDQEGKPLSPGETGEIAITDLNNYAMPLIRYLTGDIGSLSPNVCSCGRGLPLIKKIEGRIVDTLVLSDGNFINGHVFIRFFMNYSKEVEKYQFIQNVKGEVDLYIKLSRPFSEEQFEQFKSSLNNYLNNRILVHYNIIDVIPLHKSGKHKYIISNVKSDSV